MLLDNFGRGYMSIHLNTGGNVSSVEARMQAFESNLKAAKRGDWEAKKRVVAAMHDVLQGMASKRAKSNEEMNALLEAGKEGVGQAIKKFKLSSGADRFQIFAVDFIEKKMDNPSSGGFLARLFGR
jgi:hypothetical protein